MTRYVILSLLLSSGCLFRVNPAYVDPAPDMDSPPDDATSAPSPSPSNDLGMVAAPPSPDLAPSCTRVTEGFHADPSASWTMLGDAAFDDSRSELLVTSLAINA